MKRQEITIAEWINKKPIPDIPEWVNQKRPRVRAEPEDDNANESISFAAVIAIMAIFAGLL